MYQIFKICFEITAMFTLEVKYLKKISEITINDDILLFKLLCETIINNDILLFMIYLIVSIMANFKNILILYF